MQQIIFWASLGLVGYVYIGYPVLVWLVSRFAQDINPPESFQPNITIIIPAHNEEGWIRKKIANTLELNYPSDRIQVIVSSDGSTDKTVEIARSFGGAGVEVTDFAQRVGKQEMLNRLASEARGDVLVMTDSQVLLRPDSVSALVRHFANPRVACVTGKRLCILQEGVVQGAGENLYWRYESWIKQSETQLHSCLGANGQLYAVRRNVFPRVERVGEDFYIPMKILATKRMRVIFEPEAISMTPAAANLNIEFERKARAHVSFLLTLSLLKELWNPGHPVWWQYISHHVLRMAVPVAMFTALVSSMLLARSSVFFGYALAAQICFYVLAFFGYLLAKLDKRPKIFYIPFYFVFANLAIGQALWRWPFRKYDYAWKRTERIPVS